MFKKEPVRLSMTLEVVADGELSVVELGRLLKALKTELASQPRWKGRVRQIKFIRKSF
jgi:hypothetical protein